MPAPLVSRHATDPDTLAGVLGRLAAQSRNAPPSWRAGDRIPVISGEVQVGELWPGLGLRLETSLRKLGITRPIPHVFERPVWERVLDWANGSPVWTMAAAASCAAVAWRAGDLALAPLLAATLTSRDSIVEAIGAGRSNIVVWSTGVLNYGSTVANYFVFPISVHQPTRLALSTALAATAPSRSGSVGAINSFAPAPAGGEQTVLTALHELSDLGTGIAFYRTHLLADLLYEVGGFLNNSAASQTFGTAALTRYTTGVGVWATMLVTTGSNNVDLTATITYTNTVPTGSRTGTIRHESNLYSAPAYLYPSITTAAFPILPLQAGDLGIRSLQSGQWSGATGTGTFSMLLFKPLAVVLGRKYARFMTADFLRRYVPIVLEPDAYLTMLHELGADGSFRDVGTTFAASFTNV